MADKDQLRTMVTATGIGFGAAGLLTPRTLAKVYGVRSPSGDSDALLRLFGSRTLALGVASLMADGEVQDALLRMVSVIAVLDTVVAVLGGVKGDLAPRAAIMTATTAGAVAAGAAGALRG